MGSWVVVSRPHSWSQKGLDTKHCSLGLHREEHILGLKVWSGLQMLVLW